MENYYHSSQKLRILLVTHRYLRYSLGGTELLAHDVAKNLAYRGHIVYWLSTHNNKSSFSFTKLTSGVTMFEIPSFFDQYYPNRWSAQENKVSNIIEKGLREYNIQQFDIIHFFHIARIGLNFIKLPFFKIPELYLLLLIIL